MTEREQYQLELNGMMQELIDSHTEEELLSLLAEEAMELGQAALKLRRAQGVGSPTDLTEQEAIDKLKEEFTDVCLMAEALGLEVDWGVWDYKINRWYHRMEAAK